MDDQEFHRLECPGCRMVFFATREHFPTIERRGNLCPDCYKRRFLDQIGLGADFLGRYPFGI